MNRKNEGKTVPNETAKKKRWQLFVIPAVTLLVIAAATTVALLPMIQANSGLGRIVKKLREMDSPTVIVTDMKADNVFGESAGEAMISDREYAKALTLRICSVTDGMKYARKESSTLGSWNHRITVICGDERVTLYFAEDMIYYTENGAEYCFSPKDGDTSEEYAALYEEITATVK